jgi:hypothetical protein
MKPKTHVIADNCYDIKAHRDSGNIRVEFLGTTTIGTDVKLKVNLPWYMVRHLIGELRKAWAIERDSRVAEIHHIDRTIGQEAK